MEELNGFTRRELLSLIWEKPCLAQIELTRNCNLQCSFCFQGCDFREKYEELTFEQWKKVIKKLKELGVYILNFSGGEVFLYKELKKILQYSKQNGFKTVINTNGTINVEDCLDYIDEIIFSVHGLNKTHAEITGLNVFNRVEENINKASKKNIPLGINMTLVKKNFDEVLDVYNYFNARYKINKFSPTIAIQSATGTKISELNKIEYNQELFEKYFSILNQIPDKQLDLKQGLHTIYYSDKERYSNVSIADSSNCIGGKTKLVIDYQGNVYPCNFYQTPEFYCGNIVEDNVFNIWKEGKGFIKFRELALTEDVPSECRNCIKMKKCLSGCRAWTMGYMKDSKKIENGEIGYEKDMRCDIVHAFVGVGNYNKM